MSMEEYIKNETEKMIEELKIIHAKSGKVISKSEELYLRIGMSYGLTLAAKALALTSGEITMGNFI